jgi:hypothetical protein
MDELLTNRISIIEEKLEKLEKKMDPLLELLETIIKTKIDKTSMGGESMIISPKEVKETRELVYKLENDMVYIYGTKTFSTKDLIKASFKGAGWNKERSAWSFKMFENYDTIIASVFPDIIKDQ